MSDLKLKDTNVAGNGTGRVGGSGTAGPLDDIGVEGRGGRFGVAGLRDAASVPPGFGAGVLGVTNQDFGVWGESNSIGVFGKSFGNFGVQGDGPLGGGTFSSGTGVGVSGISREGTGVTGGSTFGVGVSGQGNGPGVSGTSFANDGIVGESKATGQSGVFGFNDHPDGSVSGVSGRANSPNGQGVLGRSVSGVGVRGHSDMNDGIVGETLADGQSGVFGFNDHPDGGVSGVSGRANSPNGQGVLGRSVSGVGVFGLSLGNGVGVSGSSAQGYGGILSGGRAPLLLQPASTPGRPQTGDHQRGEFYVDSQGTLFYCKDGGTPGNWFQVQLAPA